MVRGLVKLEGGQLSWFSHRQVFPLTNFRRNKILKVLNKASALALLDYEDCQTNISSGLTEPVQWKISQNCERQKWRYLWQCKFWHCSSTVLTKTCLKACSITAFKIEFYPFSFLTAIHLLLQPPCGSFVVGWLWQSATGSSQSTTLLQLRKEDG